MTTIRELEKSMLRTNLEKLTNTYRVIEKPTAIYKTYRLARHKETCLRKYTKTCSGLQT